ncbi:hypothetical protein L195_g013788, partial [Trifolium pratense]
MGAIGSSTTLLVQMLMRSEAMTVSVTLGVISVIVWMIAEIPQLITNYREKSAHGLSVAFMLTWIIGDLFNLFGCLLEPATLPTQLYTAALYTFVTLTLCLQAIYYGHIYPKLKCKKQFKIETSIDDAESNNGVENGNDADQRIVIASISWCVKNTSDSLYRSARYLSKSYTPRSEFTSQSMTSSCHILNPMEEPLLVSSVLTQSAPSLKIKNTLCLVSALTFIGAFNLLQLQDTRIQSAVSNPRKEFVIYVGRKLLQVSGDELQDHGVVEGQTSIGVYF